MDDFIQDAIHPKAKDPMPEVGPANPFNKSKPSMLVDDKPSRQTGPANPRNMKKPSMNVDSPSKKDAHRVHPRIPELDARIIGRSSIEGIGSFALVEQPKYKSPHTGGAKVGRQADPKLNLVGRGEFGLLSNELMSKKQAREAVAAALEDAKNGKKQGKPQGKFAPDQVEFDDKFPQILMGLDVDRFPPDVGVNINMDGGGENDVGTLYAALKFIDNHWVTGWETAPSFSVQGTQTLFKQVTLRAYLQSDGSLVDAGTAYNSATMFLQPTWDWDRLHS